MPDWASEIPSAPVHQEQSTQLTRPFTQQQLQEFGQQFIEQFLKRVVLALAGSFIPGANGAAFDQLVEWGVGVLTGNSQLNAGNLFGLLNPENLPNILSGSGPLNLLTNPLFQGLGSIVGGGVWAPSNQQATTTANGTLRELQGNAIPVVPNQVVDLSTLVTWSGLSYSGSEPVSLGLAIFGGGVELIHQPLAILTSPAASGNQVLSGTYTVPPDGSVDEVRLQYKVSDLATAGSVGFGAPSPNTQAPPTSIVALPGLFQQSQGIIDNVWDVFDSGIEGNTTGNPLSQLFAGMSGIHSTGSGAVSVNSVQDARLDAILVTGGVSLFDDFSGASSSTLNSTNWNQTASGAGSGTCGLSGSGYCVWTTSGTTSREWRNRYKTTLATDTQSVAVPLSANFSAPNLTYPVYADEPEIRLQARMNSAETEYVEARVRRNAVEIGYVLSGTYTRFGTTASISGDTSGTWMLKAGTLASDYEFVLLRNGIAVLSRTDSGALSAKDASHRYCGFTMHAGWALSILLGFPVQLAPPKVQSWAAADRPSAA